MNPKKYGFARMDKARLKKVTSKGGKMSAYVRQEKKLLKIQQAERKAD